MARARYNAGQGDIVRWYRGKVEPLERANEADMEQAAKEGAELMKHYISTRGTAKSGKAGRIETRNMLNAVTHELTTRGPGKTQANFGWLKQREDYFALQEGGFEHSPGVTVEGMYALTDAAEETFRDLRGRIERNLKDA